MMFYITHNLEEQKVEEKGQKLKTLPLFFSLTYKTWLRLLSTVVYFDCFNHHYLLLLNLLIVDHCDFFSWEIKLVVFWWKPLYVFFPFLVFYAYNLTAELTTWCQSLEAAQWVNRIKVRVVKCVFPPWCSQMEDPSWFFTTISFTILLCPSDLG